MYASISDGEFDFILINESWLDSLICDTEIISADYNLFRYDRNFKELRVQRGGGVFIAVRNHIPSAIIDLSHIRNAFACIDIIGIRCTLSEAYTLHIFTIYIPSSTSLSIIGEFLSLLGEIVIELPNVVIGGDFNCPKFETELQGKGKEVRSFIEYSNIEQVNFISNYMGNILDLVLSHELQAIVEREVHPLLPVDIYHPALSFTISVKSVCRITLEFLERVIILERLILLSYTTI